MRTSEPAATRASRPEQTFFADPALDRAVGMIMALATEVWVMRDRAVNRIEESPNRWQMLQGLEAYESLLATRPSIVAGDFNNAIRWDVTGKPDNHSNAVRKLTDLGLVSAYHTKWAVDQGKETHATLYWQWHKDKPYHIDYAFLSPQMGRDLRKLEIGEPAAWLQLSDHMPFSIEISQRR